LLIISGNIMNWFNSTNAKEKKAFLFVVIFAFIALIIFKYFYVLDLSKLELNFISLNSIWFSLGVTDFSFLLCLKLIFFIIFILLNIVLLYIEYLDRKYNNKYYPDSHLKAGLSPELQKFAKQVIVGGLVFFQEL